MFLLMRGVLVFFCPRKPKLFSRAPAQAAPGKLYDERVDPAPVADAEHRASVADEPAAVAEPAFGPQAGFTADILSGLWISCICN